MQQGSLIIDTHIHLYRIYDLSVLLDSAYNNISAVCQNHNVSEQFVAVLGLVLTDKECSWSELRNCKKVAGKGSSWKLTDLPDKGLIKASNKQKQVVYLVPGAQLVTSENLELLVLGVETPVYDPSKNLPWHMEKNAGALLIVPWGVGKWLGSRGEVVKQAIETFSSTLFLGDNSGRPWLWRNVEHFKLAKLKRVPVLPGTDPLPIKGEEKKAGSNIIIVDGVDLEDMSATTVVSSLLINKDNIFTRQTLEPLWRFFKNQIAMRL